MQIANRRLAPLAGLGVAAMIIAASVAGCSNSGNGRTDRPTSVTGGVGSDTVNAAPSRTPAEVEEQFRRTQGGGGGSAGRD